MSSFMSSVDAIASSFKPSTDATARVVILQNMIPRTIFKLVPQTNYEISQFPFFFNLGSLKMCYRAQFLGALHLVTPIPGRKSHPASFRLSFTAAP